MTRFAYVDGGYVPFFNALTHIEDRGYQFADGIYEVIAVINGKLIDENEHLNRMDNSLGEADLVCPLSRKNILNVINELIELNRLKNAMVYIQITRGISPRSFPYPVKNKERVTITIRPYQQLNLLKKHQNGVKVITIPDERWQRPDIKTINLLANVRAKQQANKSGAFEAVFEKNGYITEGSSSNFWCVFNGVVKTYPKSCDILSGITQMRINALAKELSVPIFSEPFTLDEAYKADEAFLTSANVLCLPVVMINQKQIGTGLPGNITLLLQRAYLEFINSI